MIDVSDLLDRLDALQTFASKYYPSRHDGPSSLRTKIETLHQAADLTSQKAAIEDLKHFLRAGSDAFLDTALVAPGSSRLDYALLSQKFSYLAVGARQKIQEICQKLQENQA